MHVAHPQNGGDVMMVWGLTLAMVLAVIAWGLYLARKQN